MESFLQQGYDDFRTFINPLVAARAELCGEPFRMMSTKDGCLVDAEDRSYHDFLAGWGTQLFGHRPAVIEQALRAYLDGTTPSFYTSGVSPYAGQLGKRLHEKTGYDAAYFASGGAEAVEAAMKLARAATGRPRIAYIEGAYHGCTYGSVAMMHRGPYRDSFGPHLPQVDVLPFNDMAALDKVLADPQLAAIVVEPIQVESGVRIPSDSYLQRLCNGTAAQGPLLIADEIQTGLGRTGQFLCSENWPRQPDVITLAKALGGGVLPLSSMLTRRDIFDRAYGSVALAEAHASTFSGNALACVAGLATLDQLSDTVVASVRNKGEIFRDVLQQAVGSSPLVSAINGSGLLWGIELQAPDHPYFNFDYLGLPELSGQPAIGLMVMHQLYKSGYITQVCGHAWHVLRLQPPLTTSDAELAAFAQALANALDTLWKLQ